MVGNSLPDSIADGSTDAIWGGGEGGDDDCDCELELF
jgi:hypothetical protein